MSFLFNYISIVIFIKVWSIFQCRYKIRYNICFENLKELKESNFNGTIFASEITVSKCLAAGVIPDYVVTTEGGVDMTKYMRAPTILQHLDMKIIHSQFTNLDVRSYLARMGFKLTLIPKNINPKLLSNVGIYMWYIVMDHFKAENIYLIGMDFTIDGRPTPKYRADSFLKVIERNPHVNTINCTGAGVIKAKNIKWCDKIE